MDRPERFDRTVGVAIILLVTAIVGLGGYFGWTIYQDRRQAEEGTPALRVIKALRQEIRKTPNDAILRVRLGEALAAAGKTQEAVEQLNAALKIDPKHTGALLDLGQIAMGSSRLPEARGYFQKVIDLVEGSQYAATSDRLEIAYFQLGRLALQDREYESAIGYFKQALRIRKDSSDSYYYLAKAFDATGEVDEAIRQLQYALAFDPSFPQAHYSLGQIYEAKGDLVSASYHYARAKQADPEAAEPLAALGKLGTAEEWLKKARDAASRSETSALEPVLIALNLGPGNEEAVKLQKQLEDDDPSGSLAVYQAVTKRDPSNRDAKAAVARLEAVLAGASKK